MFALLEYQKSQLKEDLKLELLAGIDKGKLTLLKFSEQEKQTKLDWENAHEFEYDGYMCDVVEIKTIGDTTFYWVLEDEDETELNKKLNKLVAFALGNNPDNEENQIVLLKFFKSLYITETQTTNSYALYQTKSNYFFVQRFCNTISNTPFVPPPELA